LIRDVEQNLDVMAINRAHRSELAVPATSPHFFEKAARGAADVIFLDLEDAVAPALKDTARANAIVALNTVDWGTKTVALRINSLETPWAHRDIIDVVTACPRLDLVLVPKVNEPFDIRFVVQLLAGLEREHRREKTVGIEALIETALGMTNVEAIAASSERLEALIFGVGDYSITLQTFDRDFGTPNPAYAVLGAANDQWHYALARMANACRAYGLRPIDGPYADFGDVDGFRAAAQRAAALGCEGKWAIHPSQVAPANAVFTPSTEQIAWAERVLEAIARANAEGRGALALDGKLIDMAHEKIARTILQRAARFDGRQPLAVAR
jgi:malyl-CoA/(S)-citramalyl-CoA lyase